MGIFIRYSNCLMLYTKRSMCNAALKKAVRYNSNAYTHRVVNNVTQSDLLINEKLKNFETIEENEWADVRKSLIDSFNLTETNVDSKIYDVISYHKRFDEGIRYIKFLKRNNYNLNLSTMSHYLRFYFLLNKPLTVEEDEEICSTYDNIRKQHPLLDAKTCTNCLLALSLTSRWKETLKLMDMIKISSTPGVLVPCAIICAAFRNDDPETGWEIMNKHVDKNVFVHNVYLDYLNYCKRHFKCDELIEEVKKMFIFWRKHSIYPTEHVIMNYVDLMETLGYNKHIASIERGHCTHCKLELKPITLTKTDFKLLSSSVLKSLIVGKNVYFSSSPQELKRYMVFVQTMKPYDVVIDGLNVAYSARGKPATKTQPGSLQSIINVINHFKKQKKRILVIGRVHLQWWSKDDMETIKSNADVFLTKNLSHDDPYLLHLTLLSGPDTYFVSCDLMRQHKSELDPSIQLLFKYWQLSRQYTFSLGSGPGKITLIPPLVFEPNTQKDAGGWHIPYDTRSQIKLPDMYTAPEKWVCLRENLTK